MIQVAKRPDGAIRTVIVGCGAIAEKVHRASLERLQRRGELTVVGLVEPSPERLAAARGWFSGAGAFGDMVSCYANTERVDLTLITSPPPLHLEHALAAFANGSHVLSEKPMASSVLGGRAMVEGAARYGKILAVGMPRRFYPALHEVRRRLIAGELGDAVRFIYREGGVYKWPVATASPFRRATSGGGVLLDKGAHAFDALVFMFGGGSVLSAADDAAGHGVEANARVEVALERGRGTVQMSWDMALNSGLHAWGAHGELWLPLGPLDCLYARRGPSDLWESVPMHVDWPSNSQAKDAPRGAPSGYHACFTMQLVQMLRAIRFSEPPAVTGEEALTSLGLIEAAYAMATPLVKPWLSDAERKAAARRHWRTPV